MKRFKPFLVMLILGLMGLIGPAAPPLLAAQNTPCQLVEGKDNYILNRVHPLLEAISERPSQGNDVVFQKVTATIELHPGEHVLLSGSQFNPRGFVTDDWIGVTVGDKTWEHDFRSADRQRIIPLEQAQNLTDLFEPGVNEVEIRLKDILGPVYRTSGYALLIFAPACPPTPTAQPTAQATVAATPTESPVTALTVGHDLNRQAAPAAAQAGTTDSGAATVTPASRQPFGWRFLLGLPFILIMAGVFMRQRGMNPVLVQHLQGQLQVMRARFGRMRDDLMDWIESLR